MTWSDWVVSCSCCSVHWPMRKNIRNGSSIQGIKVPSTGVFLPLNPKLWLLREFSRKDYTVDCPVNLASQARWLIFHITNENCSYLYIYVCIYKRTYLGGMNIYFITFALFIYESQKILFSNFLNYTDRVLWYTLNSPKKCTPWILITFKVNLIRSWNWNFCIYSWKTAIQLLLQDLTLVMHTFFFNLLKSLVNLLKSLFNAFFLISLVLKWNEPTAMVQDHPQSFFSFIESVID